MTFTSRRPHQRTILKTWDNKCITATQQHRGIRNDKLHQPQNTNSLRDTGNDTSHMVLKGEPAVKLHTKNVELGLAQMENPDKTKSSLGGFTVLDLLTIKALVLLLFSIIDQ